MAKSFVIDDGGDGSTWISLLLLAFAVVASVVLFSVRLPGLPTLYPNPILVWLLCHLAYRWHFRRRLAAMKAHTTHHGDETP